MKYTVYVGGPMTNRPRFNFPAFDSLAAYLRIVRGWIVHNPHEHDRELYPTIDSAEATETGDVHGLAAEIGFALTGAMRWDLSKVAGSDGIVLLDGWETSSGATHERYVAEVCGLDIWLAHRNETGIWRVQRDPEQVRIPKGALEPLAPAPATIIGLSGYAQAGKDSTGAVLVREHGYTRLAFADKLRAMLYALNPIVLGAKRVSDLVDTLGWERAKQYPEVRALLQRLGTEAGRNVLGSTVWVDALMREIEPGGKYVITDVRFPNEYDAIKAAGGQVWRIVRDGQQPANRHISETALDGYKFDCIVRTDPFEWLALTVREAMA